MLRYALAVAGAVAMISNVALAETADAAILAAHNFSGITVTPKLDHLNVESLPITELRSVLPETDVLVLALALTSDTRHIIGQKELDLLSADAVVVNVARGAHIDTEALTVALQDGRIAAAGLDVNQRIRQSPWSISPASRAGSPD